MAPAKHQRRGLQHRVNQLVSLAPSHQHYPRSTPMRLSLTCSPLWRTISRRWLHKLQCNSSTHNKQDLIKASSNKAFSNQDSRCLSRPRTTWPSVSNSSRLCNRVHRAQIRSRCNSNRSNNSNRSSQVQDLVATHRSLLARKMALHPYLRMVCLTSCSSSKCSSLLSQNQYSNSQRQLILSANRCFPACQERRSPKCSATRLAPAHSAALQPTLLRSRALAFSSNRRHLRARRHSDHHRSSPRLRRNNKHNHFSQPPQARIRLRETHRPRTPHHHPAVSLSMRLEAQILLGRAHLSTNRPDKAGKTLAAVRSAA